MISCKISCSQAALCVALSIMNGLIMPVVGRASTPGPDIIRECPRCAELFLQRTFMSGNTFGADFWSDGKTIAPMMPDQSKLAKCAKCHELIWIVDAAISKKTWRSLGVAERENLRGPEEPDEGEFLRFAAVNEGQREKEKYARLRAWWAANDAIRKHQQERIDWTPERRQNLAKLRALLNPASSYERILQAEIARELSFFPACVAILDHDVWKDDAERVALILNLARAKNPLVAKLAPIQ